MAYFRVANPQLTENDDFIDIFFNFANTYTEDSIRDGILKARKKWKDRKDKDTMRSLGYSEEDIFYMGVK